MKITIATGPIFPVPAVRGGAVQRLWEGVAREFAKRGHEVTIFAREFPGQATEETVDGIRYVRRGGYEQSTSIKRDLVQCLLYALKTARHVPPGDVVVTGDIPLAARCVQGGARVLKHNGEELTRANIGMVLATRDLMADLRAADPFRQGGGKLFGKADRSRFLDVLDRMLRAAAG
jgi:hypothetical protein